MYPLYTKRDAKNLVTHGANVADECYGAYDTTVGVNTGWGNGYANNCIHSDSNEYSGGNTVWYNYTITSAGTIIDKNTTSTNLAANTNTTTESLCPNNWSLPSKRQTEANRNISSFNPVLGGIYGNSTLYVASIYADWWASEAYNGAGRYYLNNNKGNNLYTDYGGRYQGLYIRCVSEEKTVTDLTYMQDMTPEIARALSLCI